MPGTWEEITITMFSHECTERDAWCLAPGRRLQLQCLVMNVQKEMHGAWHMGGDYKIN